jgi:2-keto-4-pentenoate hydratase
MFAKLSALTLIPGAIEEAGLILSGRRRQGVQGPVLPASCRPVSLEDALAIQAAVAARMADKIAGWKCGTPGPGKLVVAPIYASTIHTDADACPVWAQAGQVRVEPELVFVMGRDVPARVPSWSPDEVDAAIARTHLALELIDSRYEDPTALSFADKLADGLVNQGLFIGPEVDGEAARATREMPISVRTAAGGAIIHAGRHPDPLPRQPLYWLAAFLSEQGVGLQAGQVVITGSYAGTFPLPVGEAVSLRYGPLGQFDVRFRAR